MQKFSPSVPLLLLAGAALAVAGCKSFVKPVEARTDTQLAGDIQAKLSAIPAFSGPNSPTLQVAVNHGVATLDGQADNDNDRLLAATDASQVPGVHEVVNDLTVPTDQASLCAPPPVHVRHHIRRHHEPAPEMASAPPPPPAPVAPPPPPAPVYAAAPAPMCACGPVPVAVPAPVVAYGYAPVPAVGIGIGLYGRGYYGRGYYGGRGYVRPVRPYGGYYGRGGGGRGFARR